MIFNIESNKLHENLVPWWTCEQTRVQKRVKKWKMCYNITNKNSLYESYGEKKKKKS